MYGSNEFDGSAAAFMGGGFMPTQTAQPPSDSSSFTISKNREARCLFPLTVKQISNLASNDESNFIIDGAEVNNVTIVGRVCHKEDRTSEYTCLVDDGTGQIECTKWIQESIDTEEMGGILVGIYVRVHGHLRGLQGRRFLNVVSIRPVTDFNEITSHSIECIFAHFYYTRLRGCWHSALIGKSNKYPFKRLSGGPTISVAMRELTLTLLPSSLTFQRISSGKNYRFLLMMALFIIQSMMITSSLHLMPDISYALPFSSS